MAPNRGASGGPWGRLKPVELDPLDSIGLPSKGDTRYVTTAVADDEQRREKQRRWADSRRAERADCSI